MITPRFLSLWAINGPLDQTRLRRQVDELKVAGLDGVVFHPRFYPGEPTYLGTRYLAEVSDVILHAKSVGMAFWIYDEDGWPSGTVSGQLLKKYPNDVQRWADLVDQKPERCLAEIECDGKKWFLAERIGHGVDYFNPDLARHFIELTHERYRTGLNPEAWEHVEAIFSDEPEFGLGHAYDSLSRHGAIPWTPKLPELFYQHFGEDLMTQISGLFFAEAGAAATRIKFWELLTDVFNESFTAPINDWCNKYSKLFTAHVKGEEHPLFQVPTNGSCHQFFRNLALPGIDALERHAANNFYPRQVSSVARQFGSGRCMVEAFGGAGWGASPEDLERYLLWLGRNGLTDFALHLSQYRLDSAAMHDWPPSEPLHLTWREVYPDVLNRVRHELGKNPRPAADTLVIAPNRGIMANYQPQEFLQTNVHNAAMYPDTVAGRINRRFLGQLEELDRASVNYEIADERTLEQFGRVIVGKLVLGKCDYRRVIVPEGCKLNEATVSAIQPLTYKMEPSVTEIKMSRRDGVHKFTVPVHWKLEAHPLNSLLLEPTSESDGSFSAGFKCAAGLGDASLEIVFADDVGSLNVNGRDLSLKSSTEGSVARLAGTGIDGMNTIRFRTIKYVERPFLWLKGCFHIGSSEPFTVGPNQTIKTSGFFTVNPAQRTLDLDLVAGGFPFLQTKLTASAEVELLAEITRLRLDGVEADAVRLHVDGQDLGWQWRTDDEVCFATHLSGGKHRLKIELLPSTFNGFGPHHYYAGDWHVISPDQIKGIRNFADVSDAPVKTHVAAWHFRRFHLPVEISVS